MDGVLVNNSANVVDKSVRYLQKHANVPVRYRTYKHMQKTKQTGVQKKPWPHLVHRGTRNGVWEYNNYVFDKDTLLDFVRNAVITIPIDAEYETLQTLSPTHTWITAPRRPRQSACAFHVRHGVFETDRKLLRTRRVQTGERVQQHTLHGRQRSQHDRRSTTSAMASSARPYAYRAVRRVGQDSEIITNKIIFGYRNNSCSIEQPP